MLGRQPVSPLLLVEDDHQGRGMGTCLAQELLTVSTRGGGNDFVVLTLPDNQMMERIVRRIAHAVQTDRNHETVTFRFSVPAPATQMVRADTTRC